MPEMSDTGSDTMPPQGELSEVEPVTSTATPSSATLPSGAPALIVSLPDPQTTHVQFSYDVARHLRRIKNLQANRPVTGQDTRSDTAE
jgi:hypothetical protein